MDKKLVLIDGNSLFNRAFHATPMFTTTDGLHTNAVYGFIKLIIKIIGDMKPSNLVIAFDMKSPTFRHKMYDEYKGTRKPMVPELSEQVPILKDTVAQMGFATCEMEGYEADDIIGTLAKRFSVPTYIYTGDRDSYQLVDETTHVMFTKKGVSDILELSLENFTQETGLERPEQVIDYKALRGDTSDNIPGVHGIGEVTAMKYLSLYHDIDNIYSHLDEIKGKDRGKLENGKEICYLSKTLATINCSVPIEMTLEDCVCPEKFTAEVRETFRKLQFKSLISVDMFEDVSSESLPIQENKAEEIKVTKLSDFDLNSNVFAVDIAEDVKIYCNGKEYTVPQPQSLFDEVIDFGDLLKAYRRIFEDEKNTVIVFDNKEIRHKLKEMGISPTCRFEDVSICAYLNAKTDASYTLDNLMSSRDINKENRAYALFVLFGEYKEMMKGQSAEKLYEEIELPLSQVLFEMEECGVKIDMDKLQEFGERYGALANSYAKEIVELAGMPFNVNSPTQLAKVLFEYMGIPYPKSGKDKKYSTSAEILTPLAKKYPIVDLILKYRSIQKLVSTYIEPYKLNLSKETYIHTTFNQTVTSTGRLSSSNPNLQNIPVREEEGRELRKMFVASEGNVLIDADYSQIELRILAHMAECPKLIEFFNKEYDVHRATAADVFGVPFEEVTDKMRRQAKTVNFGIIYGMGSFSLSNDLDISVKEAKEIIDKYFETYPEVQTFMEKSVEFAHENGYVETLYGRKRYIPALSSSNYSQRQFGERAAKNMPLQGTSADIIKVAMINVHRALKEGGYKAKLILQIHDELLIDCPAEEENEVKALLVECMQNACKLSVPLTVGVGVGKSWYDAKD